VCFGEFGEYLALEDAWDELLVTHTYSSVWGY